jgi:pterin-4a-carbinolamine dehydratase
MSPWHVKAMATSIFLNYRRSDSQHAAFAIANRLEWEFGEKEVFLDRGSIESGAKWPETIRDSLASAKVIVVLIGPTWLRTHDEWGRRRLDHPEDWVRIEICEALRRAKTTPPSVLVIPVFLDLDEKAQPKSEGLDELLRPLLAQQAHQLTNGAWQHDLEGLVELIAKKTKISRLTPDDKRHPNGSPARPEATQHDRTPMTDEKVRQELTERDGWRLQWNAHPWGTGGRAQEIARTYPFKSFLDAVAFMQRAALSIEKWDPPHHPRWENQWKVVTAYFSTWDCNCRVTELDIKAAGDLNALYYEFCAASK